MRAVLFDFDGTLLDSQAMVIRCFTYLFDKYRTREEFTRDLQLEVFGPPLYEEMCKLFPDQDPNQMIEEYREYQNTLPGTGAVHLIAYAKDVCQRLYDAGIPMGVVSSRLTESCQMWMREFDLEHYFEFILGQEKFDKPKPDPEGILKACAILSVQPENTIYIGDNASDVIAAQRAGAVSVGFISEKEKENEILDANPDYAIYDLRVLLQITEG